MWVQFTLHKPICSKLFKLYLYQFRAKIYQKIIVLKRFSLILLQNYVYQACGLQNEESKKPTEFILNC